MRPTFNQDPNRPRIKTNGRPLEHVTQDVLSALAIWNNPPRIFQRGRELVRIADDDKGRPIIESLDMGRLRGEVVRSAEFYRLNKAKDGGFYETVGLPLSETISDLQKMADWGDAFQSLTAIMETPGLRPDGSLLIDKGYDVETGYYYRPTDGLVIPTIPENPTKIQLANAVSVIEDVIGEFPFGTPADKANAYALMLTPIIRPALGAAGLVPLALADAPKQGTGKGLYVTTVIIVATGRMSSSPMSADRQPDEWRKTITASLRSGTTFIVIDNITETLKNDSLSAALTTATWKDRVLGASEEIEVPVHVTWVATGNNIHVGGDLIRRCYKIRMDALTARPWRRRGPKPGEVFKHENLEEYVSEHRGEILAALLTLCRGWFAAGRPKGDVPRVGSYQPWANAISGILTVAGIKGFLGNLDQFYEEGDTETPEWEAFLTAWDIRIGRSPITTAELVLKIQEDFSPLRAVLPAELADAYGRNNFNIVLGQTLRSRVADRVGEKNLFIDRAPSDPHSKAARWQLSSGGMGLDG